jgi:predicted MFS family arabinose efflux permease
MGLYGVYTYLGAGLVTNGFTTSQSAQAILSYGCGAVAGALIGGNLADRTGVRFAIGLSFGGLCGCFLLLRLAFYEHTLVAPALGISSAVAQLFFPAQQAGLAKDFPSQRAAALAWNNSALYLGISLGSLLGATMMAIGNFGDNLIMSAIITSLGWILNRAIPPKLDDPLR